MADLSSWVTLAPSDSSTVFPTAGFLRQQWRLLDQGLRQSLDLPSGELQQGAAPINITLESILSASGGASENRFEVHMQPHFFSDTSRMVVFRTKTVNDTFSGTDHHLIGTHKFIEHSDYTATTVRTVVSGSTRLAANPNGVTSLISFMLSGATTGSAQIVAFATPPRVLVSTEEGTTINYVPRVTSVDTQSFAVILRPLDHVHAGSAVTLHFTAVGERSVIS